MFVLRKGFNCEVLTIRDGEPVSLGCWKFLGNCPRNLWGTVCACANGIMYWIYSGSHSSSGYFLSQDLEKEKFRGYVLSLDLEEEEFGIITDLPL